MSARINPELLRLAKEALDRQRAKRAFVAAGDPAMDPAAAAAGDPAAGGAPPAGDPAMGGDPAAAAGGDPMAALGPLIDQRIQAVMASQGGGAGGGMGGAEPIKPKIDINVEIMKIQKILAKIADTMGIVIPASDMVATSTDLTQMAQAQQGAPATAGGGGGAIPPIQPMTPMKAAAESTWDPGVAFTPPATMMRAHTSQAQQLTNAAQAMLLQHRVRRGG